MPSWKSHELRVKPEAWCTAPRVNTKFFARSKASRLRRGPGGPDCGGQVIQISAPGSFQVSSFTGHFIKAMYNSLVDAITTDPELMVFSLGRRVQPLMELGMCRNAEAKVLPLDDHAIVRTALEPV